MTSPSFWLAVTLHLARRPSLWSTAWSQVFRLAAPGWWRRAPFLPLPEAGYLAFRMETQYGNEKDPDPADVVTYLRWCRAFGQLS